MDESDKNIIPQVGTDYVGESHPSASAGGRPHVSVGGHQPSRSNDRSSYDPADDGRLSSPRMAGVKSLTRVTRSGRLWQSTSDVGLETEEVRFTPMESDEYLSTDSARLSKRGGRKRPPPPLFCDTNSGSDTETDVTVAKRRGKADPSGKKAAVTRAKSKLREMETEAAEDAFEAELRKEIKRKEYKKAQPAPKPIETKNVECLGSDELRAWADGKVNQVLDVARKSGSLKGDMVRVLKDSAVALKDIVDVLASRTEAEETRRVRAENARLRKEVEALHVEVKAMRRDFSERKSLQPTQSEQMPSQPTLTDLLCDMEKRLLNTVGNIITARLEGRVIQVDRPPLAADKKRMAAAVAKPVASAAAAGSLRVPTPASKKPGPAYQKKVTAVDLPLLMTPVVQQENLPSIAQYVTTDTEADEPGTWATVVRGKGKGKGKKSKPAPQTNAAAPSTSTGIQARKPQKAMHNKNASGSAPQPAKSVSKRKAKKLTAPRTAAVVITLQPEAAEKGITYANTMLKARQSLNLPEMGIGPVKVRTAVTGAKIIEVSGEDKNAKADVLAEKIHAAIGEVAKVVRPTKMAEISISGLDESVLKEEIVAEVSNKGGCSTEAIKAGVIRFGPRGNGRVTVSCPIEAAKKLIEAGRFLVGWSSARVEALAPRPMRCYRCMGVGHTSELCPSSVDRSDQCYRCSRTGHFAKDCFADAHCSVCEAAKKPAGHIMGGRNCNPPNVRGKVTSRTEAVRARVNSLSMEVVEPNTAQNE